MATAPDPRDAYLAEFDRLVKEDGTDAPWVRRVRESGIERFRALGFPGPKDEAWKYTNVAPIARTPFALEPRAEAPNIPPDLVDPFTFGVLKCSQLVFLNGRFAPKLSYLRWLPEGVRVRSLAEVVRTDPGSVEPRLSRTAELDGNPFTALNTAFMQDGAFIHVPEGRIVEEAIHVLFVSTPHRGPTVSHPRNLILLGDNSQLTIIESYVGLDGGTYLTNGVTEVAVGANAVLDHHKVQREGADSYHVARMDVVQGPASSVTCHSTALGASLARNDVNTRFDGEGGGLVLNGLYALAGRQHVDNHTLIDHAKPNCTSSELYKGVLDGRSRGVFYGKVIVRKDAQKTVARQTNKNLMLSKDAHVDSTPGLEILANDVKCNHGSSIGQLDPDAIFYLRSRAIDPETARTLLTYAFAAEIVRQVKVAPLRIKLDQLLLSRLPRGESIRESL